jgi:hypothetical protein
MTKDNQIENRLAEIAEKASDKNNPYVEIYKQKLQKLLKDYESAQQEIAELNIKLDQTLQLVTADAESPSWTLPENNEKGYSDNIPVLLVSDVHYGENVNPREVPDGNCYSPRVSDERWDRLINNTILKTRAKGKSSKGIVVCFLGDDISGDIHDELKETNYQTPIDACMSVAQQKIKMLKAFEQEFGKVWAISVMGNHGRTNKKPQSKGVSEHNYDTLITAIVQRQLEENKNITFYTPKSGEAYFELCGYNFLATHGDRIGSRGGQGFIGCSATIARGQHKTRQAYSQIKKPIDWLLIGHFHTPILLEHTIANGTLVGYSQYARDLKIEPSYPSQTLFYVDKTYGVTDVSRIYVTNQEQLKKDRQLYFRGSDKLVDKFVISSQNKKKGQKERE